MNRVYISGPITGLEREEYFARFARAEEILQEEGYTTLNPTRLLPSRWPWLYRLMGYRLTLLYDLWRLSKCDLIYKMPGWKESHGANIESCWAYNNGIFSVPRLQREAIDKKMVKFITRKWESGETITANLAELQHQAQSQKATVPVGSTGGQKPPKAK